MNNISAANSIFQQPWWLDAVAPNQWSEVVVKNGASILARMPFMIKKKFGLTLLTMPELTQTLGPWLVPSTAKYAKQLSQQKSLMTALIEQLPPYDYFFQNFHYSVTNWLPLFWRGFNQTTRYSYVIEMLEDLDLIWAQFQENIRREIRKAEKKLGVRTDLDVECFIRMHAMSFKRQGKAIPESFNQIIRRLDIACEECNARRMFFAEDAKGRVHAAVYLVWDQSSAYYLMGGADPELRTSGASSLLVWEAIKFAASVTKKFDFEGSMIESVERFFRGFGAVQKPYFQITHLSRRMKLLMAGRDAANAILRRS